MPMAVTKLKTYDEVWKLARRQAGELMEEAANDMTWENIIGSDNMTISDFVENGLSAWKTIWSA